MNRFEAAQIFGLLSDANQLKIVKMAYNHGIVTLNGIVEKMGIGDGRTGGFVQLSKEDAAAIYHIAANGSI